MKQLLAVIFTLTFSLPVQSAADNHLAKFWPEGSAVHTVNCLADITRARTKELQNLLACATESRECK